jgi:hypothetical protein
MLMGNSNQENQRYNVVINGTVKKRNVPKRVAETYFFELDDATQEMAEIIPVTEDGKSILLG